LPGRRLGEKEKKASKKRANFTEGGGPLLLVFANGPAKRWGKKDRRENIKI